MRTTPVYERGSRLRQPVVNRGLTSGVALEHCLLNQLQLMRQLVLDVREGATLFVDTLH